MTSYLQSVECEPCMRKLDAPYVAAALLYLDDDQHSDSLTTKIIESDLSELGYKGGTPERTLNSQLRNSRTYSKFFVSGSWPAHFRLSHRASVLKLDEVRCALFALLTQRPMSELKRSAVVEFTFRARRVVGIRNHLQLLEDDAPQLAKVVIPTGISEADLTFRTSHF